MGSQPPPGCLVPTQGPSPRPGQRMAQEAFEAYGKSSPLPAPPHLPFPPGHVRPLVSMGTGGSRHGTLNTWQRRGDYRQGAAAAGETGVYRRNPRKGHDRATRARNVHVPCAPSPPTARAPRPGTGRSPIAMRSACPQQTEQPGGEAAGGRRGTTGPCLAECSHSACPQRKEHACCQRRGHRVRRAPKRATRLTPPPPHRGRKRGTEAGGEAKKRRAPPPQTSAAPRACIVLAACILRRKDNKGAPPPPLTPTPSGRGRRQRGDGKRAPNRQSSWVGRQQGEDEVQQGRASQSARTVLAPNGGNMPGAGTQGTKGAEGSHTANPPPPPHREKERSRSERGGQEGKSPSPQTSAAPRACIVLAACMLRRTDNKGTPPPPHPQTPRKGTMTARGQNGDMGGDAGVTTRPEGETGGKQWGCQAA